jgi:glutamate-ammonia-ligase adenylyltransferase
MFIDNPHLVDQLVLHQGEGIRKTRKEMEEELSREIQLEEDSERKLAVLRRYQSEETLRIGMMHVFGELGVEEASQQLTRLAEACINGCLSLALERIDPRKGGGEDGQPPFVIMAMGRLGGEELNFNSDLDILFVYDIGHAHPSAGRELKAEYFVRLAQGLGYRVDMRLRPSGTVGPLVVFLNSFRDYYRGEALLWERQALIRARVVAGHPGLGEQLMQEVNRFAYEAPLPPHTAAEILRLRQRMEIELARETENRFNLKTGRGGLVDVEFSVQYLQMKHGGERLRLREPNTLKAMKTLGQEGILTGEDLHVLMDGYKYLRRVETHLRIVHDFSADELRFDGDEAEQIARGLEYEARGGLCAANAMREEYEQVTRSVRDAYKRLVV